MPTSHMWLVASVLDTAGVDYIRNNERRGENTVVFSMGRKAQVVYKPQSKIYIYLASHKTVCSK